MVRHIGLCVRCVVRPALRVQGRADNGDDMIKVALNAALPGALGAERTDNIRPAVNTGAAVIACRQCSRSAIITKRANSINKKRATCIDVLIVLSVLSRKVCV